MNRVVGFAFVACAALCVATLSWAQPPEGSVTLFSLDVTVAEVDDAPVVTPDWIREQLRNANALFRPHGVSFRHADSHTVPEAHARLENRRDRHRLGHYLHPGRIDVFVVASLRDVDEPSRFRQGVHWRPRGDAYQPGSHFVIVSRIAGPTVLAHELGHYFGNPHSDTPGNIMSYERGDRPPFFDDLQSRRIRRFTRRFVREGELVELPSPSDEATGPAR